MNPRASSRAGLTALAVVAIAGVVSAVGAWLSPQRAAESYLTAYVTVLSTVLGILLMLMTIELAGGAWFTAFRRDAERIVGTLPVLGLLFVPLLIGASTIYPWAGSPAGLSAEMRATIDAKWPYLTPGFAIVRALIYQSVWIGVGEIVRRASFTRDDNRSLETAHKLRVLSVVGVILVGVTSTFASFDWLMSLSPDWASSIFGVYYYAGSTVAALALVSLTFGVILRRGIGRPVTTEGLHALGNLLLAFVLLWAYLAYSQFLIIWIADLPAEAGWLALRSRGSWGALGVILFLGHFALPFLLLLAPSVKRSAVAMAAIGAWLLLMHYLDISWLVAPAHPRPRQACGWLDFATLAFVAGLTIMTAYWRRQPSSVGTAPVPAGVGPASSPST
jgi:hypothetical protein